ncbi:MAG: cupredoxin domain-containing protein [Chloroflexota bacterium]|nr:cupredoxin domain-containing protein [Chloroflexota bacterium]
MRILLVLVALVALGGLFTVLRPDTSGAGPQHRTLEARIQDGKLSPATIEVYEGDQLTLRLTSDKAAELHLHGYDRELEVEPGETATLELKADQGGRFELEDHDSGAPLGQLVVRPR